MNNLLSYSEQNWEQLLESLNFTEQKNPNGIDCYDIYDEKGLPRFQYSAEQREWMYTFLSGAIWWQIHTM